jgi:hypothetical protein
MDHNSECMSNKFYKTKQDNQYASSPINFFQREDNGNNNSVNNLLICVLSLTARDKL